MQTTPSESVAATRWSSAEREDFFRAIARHRRASWRATLAAAFAMTVAAVVVAVLVSPLLYCIAALGLDAVNLVRPAPDLLGAAFHSLEPLLDTPRLVPLARWLRVTALAATPGLALMAVVVLAMRRVLSHSPWFTGGDVPGRPVDATRLAEQRFANTVEEMCIAAQLPRPRILIADDLGGNGVALGRDERSATIVVGPQLLAALDRAGCVGVAGHLVGSIANGDLPIGLRTATTLALFHLLGRLGASFPGGRPLTLVARVVAALVVPGGATARALADDVVSPFGPEPAAGAASASRGWRDWLVLPLSGPVMIAGFLTSFLAAFLLTPLVALAWRDRKYLADATAVRLTRDPDGLAGALRALAQAGRGGRIAPWAAPLALRESAERDGGLGSSVVPPFPSVERRERALARLGAHVTLDAHRLPWLLRLALAALLVVVAGLLGLVVYLLMVVSVMLSGIFTLVPAALLHVLLRHLAH
jgi:Zn-dependent protease with chaperone function